GHFGDRVGRKSMLTLSLLLMGLCTVLIGLLPTYEQIGISAAVLLVVLRIGQGLSFGGEMGGAMLMAVEHAPPKWKAFFGSLPLVGAPLGILLSVGSFALVTRLPEEDFLSWGWRLPFLASAVLIVVGLFIRHGIDESPEFERVKRERAQARQPLEDKMPLRELLRAHGKSLLLCIGCKIAEVTLIYTFLVFSVSYAVSKLGFSRADALHALLYGAGVLMFTIPLFGMLADRIGARRVCGWGGMILGLMAIPIFLAVGSGSLLAYSLAVFVAMAFNYAIMIAPQSSLYSAQFPAELRYSGLSIGVQFSAAIGGGLAPLISATLVQKFDSIVPVGVYLAVLGIVAGTSAFLMKPTPQDLRRG
ncbi:MAG TPA: MFS transporter, partial [Achromobacter sp.]|nr:MFS transporter [Achromobacter sp.]